MILGFQIAEPNVGTPDESPSNIGDGQSELGLPYQERRSEMLVNSAMLP